MKTTIFVTVADFLENSNNLKGKECFSHQPGSMSDNKFYPLGEVISFNNYKVTLKNKLNEIFEEPNLETWVEIEATPIYN